MVLNLQCNCNLLNTLLRKNYEELHIGLKSQDIQKGPHFRVLSRVIYSDFNKLQSSMEGFVEKHRKESIKNTVMKHEEIFKQQVQELHRLYEVQKKLMNEVKSEELKMSNSILAPNNPYVITDSFRNSKNTSETSHYSNASALNHSTDVPNYEYTSIHRFSAGQSSHELSNCFAEPLRISKEYNFQQPFEGERHDSRSNLDLNLSIGYATYMNKEADWKQMGNDSSLLRSSNLNRPDSIQEFTNSAGGFDSESLKRPHWLFQALSLNRT
ncbi:hypothetical protein M5K25_027839 [Dendrobium thyrsiflorum]|uniref:Uncharacterized protein n=1 Tax=Dendrobium thyrsiflorum TaxID=117978 RepID=A0ABD0TUV7_DENTH